MAGIYEDDLRNAGRNGIADTLAARKSPVGYGLEQAGRAMSQSPFSAASKTAEGAVPMIGGSASSILPMQQMPQFDTQMPQLPQISAEGGRVPQLGAAMSMPLGGGQLGMSGTTQPQRRMAPGAQLQYRRQF